MSKDVLFFKSATEKMLMRFRPEPVKVSRLVKAHEDKELVDSAKMKGKDVDPPVLRSVASDGHEMFASLEFEFGFFSDTSNPNANTSTIHRIHMS